MELVATLISDPASPALAPHIVDHAASLLNSRGGSDIAVNWLAGRIACDLFFVGEGESFLSTDDFDQEPIDVVVQARRNRRKRALIADMDSTIIDVECLDELADFAGIKDRISAITERAMRGELDFEQAILERVAMLKGLDEAALSETWQSRINLTPGARELVATMKANGAVTELISGGFTFFTSRVREAVGFDADHANELLVENGKLTGDIKRPILGADAKLTGLNRIAKDHGLTPADIMAVGDGANDIPMLEAAGAGVAFHAKPATVAAANMNVQHSDLTALLYIQGYRDADFVRS